MRALVSLPTHGADGPTDAPIHAIHRGPSGYIPLAVKDDGDGRKWRELGAIEIGQPFLPGLLAQLAADGYFGLNTSYRTGLRFRTETRHRWQPIEGYPGAEEHATRTRTIKETTNKATGLAHAQHDQSTLRWLNVAYADLDCYNRGLSVGDAIGALVNMQDAGTLPPATMFARSGRGLWAFWFLLDKLNPAEGERTIYGQSHHPGTPARATTRALALYARVQSAIVRKLAHLGADLGAVDGPRFAPMPGTLKTSTDARVLYWVQGAAQGPAAYTLETLATAMGLELQRKEHPVIIRALSSEPTDAPKNERRQAAGRKGWVVRWQNTVLDFELLIRLSTFQDRLLQGGASRNRFALFYAAALYRAGMSKADTETRIVMFGERFRMANDEIRGALKQAFRRFKYPHLRRDTYIQEFSVTQTEWSYLDAHRKPETAPTAGKASIGARWNAILDAIAENGGRVPSVRQMCSHLTAAGIPSGNHTTVHRDYRKLGLKPATRPGRPPKLPL